MAGYTPVFDTVFDGTLCGQWPALPVWLTILPLADWRGHIDMTPKAIAARTGWPMDLLMEGLATLCEPDPNSRSPAEDGRRLVLIDPARNWGWRVVNIHKYREKASGADQVADGRNAEKVRRYREKNKTPTDTGQHRASPADTNSYTDTNTNTDSSKSKTRAREPEDVPRGTFAKIRDCYPLGLYREADWMLAERAIRKRMDEGIPIADLVAAASAYALQQIALEKVGTQYVLKPSAFFGDSGEWRGPFPTPAKPENAYDRLMRLNGGTPDTRIIEHEPDSAGPDFLALA